MYQSYLLDRRLDDNIQPRLSHPQSAGKLAMDRPARLDDFPTPQQRLKALQDDSPKNQRQFYENQIQDKAHRGPPRHDQLGPKDPELARHNELLNLNERFLEKEETVMKKENEINLYRNEIESLKDECGRFKSKLHAVELYASELQRKNDLLTQEITEKNTIIQELQSSDLNLRTQLNLVILSILESSLIN